MNRCSYCGKSTLTPTERAASKETLTYCQCCGVVVGNPDEWTIPVQQMAGLLAQSLPPALRETEAALARYPSGWSEPASEWDKIP